MLCRLPTEGFGTRRYLGDRRAQLLATARGPCVCNLPTVRLYDLRHTCATLLLARNVHPKYVQELLGHASITLTLDTYSHVLPGMDGGAASAMDEALG